MVTTTPDVDERELFLRRRCYMGISLDNPVFQNASLHALVHWAIEHFDECLIVVGDLLRRFNEEMLNGLQGPQATAAALAEGDAFLSRTQAFFRSLPAGRVRIVRWKDCLDDPSFREARAIIDRLYAEQETFRAAVQRDSWSFVRRQRRRGNPLVVTEERAIELSCLYLLEETAVFSSLAEQGWEVELYPGPELEVLEEIARGSFNGIPAGLRKRINVELSIRGEKADA